MSEKAEKKAKKVSTKVEGKKVYEIGYLVVPTVTEELVAKEVDAIKSVLAKANAEVIAEGAPELRALAYTMIKPAGSTRPRYNQAYFGWVKFEVATEEIVAIKKAVEGMEKILRALTIETVRENTLYGPKLAPAEGKAEEAGAAPAPAAAPAASTEEEIDKAVEKLVI